MGREFKRQNDDDSQQARQSSHVGANPPKKSNQRQYKNTTSNYQQGIDNQDVNIQLEIEKGGRH